MTNNQINHNLIEIIQLSLTIFDLWSHSHLWMVGWVDGHFEIYLNHLSPLQGYFLTYLKGVKGHLLLRLSIKNLSIGGAYGALLNLFWIFDYMTVGSFGGLLSADCPDVEKVGELL